MAEGDGRSGGAEGRGGELEGAFGIARFAECVALEIKSMRFAVRRL